MAKGPKKAAAGQTTSAPVSRRRVRAPGLTARQVKALRVFLGLEQSEFAELIEVTRLNIVGIEKGQTRCAGSTAMRIIELAARNDLFFCGPNIPHEFRSVRDTSTHLGDGLFSEALNDNDKWTVLEVMLPPDGPRMTYDSPELVHPTKPLPSVADAIAGPSPGSVSFDGTAVTGSFKCRSRAELDMLIAIMQAQRGLLRQ